MYERINTRSKRNKYINDNSSKSKVSSKICKIRPFSFGDYFINFDLKSFYSKKTSMSNTLLNKENKCVSSHKEVDKKILAKFEAEKLLKAKLIKYRILSVENSISEFLNKINKQWHIKTFRNIFKEKIINENRFSNKSELYKDYDLNIFYINNILLLIALSTFPLCRNKEGDEKFFINSISENKIDLTFLKINYTHRLNNSRISNINDYHSIINYLSLRIDLLKYYFDNNHHQNNLNNGNIDERYIEDKNKDYLITSESKIKSFIDSNIKNEFYDNNNYNNNKIYSYTKYEDAIIIEIHKLKNTGKEKRYFSKLRFITKKSDTLIESYYDALFENLRTKKDMVSLMIFLEYFLLILSSYCIFKEIKDNKINENNYSRLIGISDVFYDSSDEENEIISRITEKLEKNISPNNDMIKEDANTNLEIDRINTKTKQKKKQKSIDEEKNLKEKLNLNNDNISTNLDENISNNKKINENANNKNFSFVRNKDKSSGRKKIVLDQLSDCEANN